MNFNIFKKVDLDNDKAPTGQKYSWCNECTIDSKNNKWDYEKFYKLV